MAISGKVYIVPDPKTRSWELFIENRGQQEFGLTHNIFPNRGSEVDVHDDHQNYGHGLPVRGGKVTSLRFQEGATYNGKRITEKSVIRVGIRAHAYKTVQLPALRGGRPLELDLRDFDWYNGSPDQVGHSTAAHMDSYAASSRTKLNIDASRQSLTRKIASLRSAASLGVKLKGSIEIEAVPNDVGALSHWRVVFANDGKTPFIGTAAFVDAKDKNEGIGLESMPVPNKGSTAVQRIEAMGNYGTMARPGAMLRVGIRGYGYLELELPDGGKNVADVNEFFIDATKKSPDFFDQKKVEEKRNEKLKQVQFFEGGKAINDELKPITYRGAEALARSTYDPPHLKITTVEGTEEHPNGGWQIDLMSRMPDSDDRGKVGFVTTVRLGRTGWDPATIPPKKFGSPEEQKSWFVPADTKIGDNVAQPGELMIVGTRGMGWFAPVRLPGPGEVLDSDQDDQLWAFREDQYNRGNLEPEFYERCKD